MPNNLLLSPEEWDALPQRLEDPFFQQVHANNEKATAIMLEQGRDDFWCLAGDLRNETPERGNPWRWRVIKHRLYRFSISWRLTGNETSKREALRAVDELLNPELRCPAFTGNGITYADLKTGDLWVCASFAIEALEPCLSTGQKNGLIAMLREWALPAYLKGFEYGDWWRHAEFNWGSAVHSGAGIAALAIEPEYPELAAEVLHHVREGLSYVVANFQEGGCWIEGLMYHTTTLAHMTDFIYAHLRLKGDDLGLRANSRLHDSFDSRLWMIGGDDLPLNFSNIGESTTEWRLPHAYWWAHQCDRPEWAGFEDAYPRVWYDTNGVYLQVETFWFRKPFQKTEPYQQPQGLWHARELDWLSWKRKNTWFAFRSGDNGGNHTNRDLGQIIFGIGRERLLRDPGYGSVSTSQHSCVAFRGSDQTQGAFGKIFRTQELESAGQDLLYVCCDLTEAYPSILRYHYRHALVSSSGWLLILDEFLAQRGLRAGAVGHLQSILPFVQEADTWSLHGEKTTYRIDFLTRVWRFSNESFENSKTKGDTQTLAFRPFQDAPFSRMAVFLAPEGTPSPELKFDGVNAQFVIEDCEVRLNLAEGTAHIPFKR